MCDSSGPSGYCRRVSTATSTPGSSSVDSETSRAVFSGTSDAIRTGSKRDPGAVSIVAMMSDASIPRSAPSRCATSWRRLNGRSAGLTRTVHDATLETSSLPFRS